jgi:hypothetical protein
MRKFARILALVLVAVTSVIGLSNIPDEFSNVGATRLQQSVQFGAVVHAVLGLLVVIGMLRRRPWVISVVFTWAVAVVYTASAASMAWASPRDRGVLFGAAAAGISCALFGWWVVWAARDFLAANIPATDSASSNR